MGSLRHSCRRVHHSSSTTRSSKAVRVTHRFVSPSTTSHTATSPPLCAPSPCSENTISRHLCSSTYVNLRVRQHAFLTTRTCVLHIPPRSSCISVVFQCCLPTPIPPPPPHTHTHTQHSFLCMAITPTDAAMVAHLHRTQRRWGKKLNSQCARTESQGASLRQRSV
jgi:hypothetical protein